MRNLKKLILLVVFMITSMMATAATLDTIQKNGVLRVGTTGDYAPFTILKDGQYEGYDIEVAKYFAKQLGVEVKFVPTTWSNLLDDLNSDKFDIAMGGISQNLTRKLASELSNAYLTYGKTPLVRTENKDKYDKFEKIDVSGVKVGYNVGGTNEQYALKNLKKAILVKFDKNLDVVQAVKDKKIDVMISETPEAVHYENIDKDLVSPMTSKPLTKNRLGYLVAKGNREFVSVIDYIMRDMELKGTKREMQRKYIK